MNGAKDVGQTERQPQVHAALDSLVDQVERAEDLCSTVWNRVHSVVVPENQIPAEMTSTASKSQPENLCEVAEKIRIAAERIREVSNSYEHLAARLEV